MSKQRLPTWALAWLTGLAVIAVIFLANQGAVNRLMDSMGLSRLLYPAGTDLADAVVHQQPVANSLPAQINLDSPPRFPNLPPEAQSPADPDVQASEPNSSPTSASTALPDTGTAGIVRQPAPLNTPPSTTATSPPTSTPAGDLASTPAVIATTNTNTTAGTANTATNGGPKLYFLKMGPDGRLEPTAYERAMVANSSPLTTVLQSLLMGPTVFEKKDGAISLIPIGTQLLSVRIQNGTAYLSFSPEFAHNTLGLEGLVGQLKEIVWTATQFSSVSRVQILINGQYSEAKSVDGLSMALPLERSSLR